MSLLEYPVTRPIVLRRWVIACIISGAVIWIVLITLVNVVAVGYELVSVSSTDFNNTARNWYEKVNHLNHVIPSSWNCLYSVIKVNESCSPTG